MWCCSWAFSHKLIELLSIFHTQKWFVCFGCSFVEAHDFLFSPRNLAQFRCGCGCECNTQLFAPTAIVKHRMPLSKCRRPMWLSCNYYSCSFFSPSCTTWWMWTALQATRFVGSLYVRVILRSYYQYQWMFLNSWTKKLHQRTAAPWLYVTLNIM